MPQDMARTSRSRSPAEVLNSKLNKRSVSQINVPYYPATAFKSQYVPSDRENFIDLQNKKVGNDKKMER